MTPGAPRWRTKQGTIVEGHRYPCALSFMRGGKEYTGCPYITKVTPTAPCSYEDCPGSPKPKDRA